MSSYEFISRHIIEEFGREPSSVRPDATLEELGLNSLSAVELILDVEEEFDVELLAERKRFTTLGEAAAVVDELILARGS